MTARCSHRPGAMSWFTIAEGRLRFGGRVTKDPVREWLATPEGSSAVAEAATRRRFSLFGRTRAARRQMSRALWEAISAPGVRQVIAAESDGYVGAWTPLAYAPTLPRVSVEYRVGRGRPTRDDRVEGRVEGDGSRRRLGAGGGRSRHLSDVLLALGPQPDGPRDSKCGAVSAAPAGRQGIVGLRRRRQRDVLGRCARPRVGVAGPRGDVRDALATVVATRPSVARRSDRAAVRVAAACHVPSATGPCASRWMRSGRSRPRPFWRRAPGACSSDESCPSASTSVIERKPTAERASRPPV